MTDSRPIATPRIGVFGLIMIASAFVVNVRNFPLLADQGLSMIVLVVIAVVGFQLPSALVSAELATGWPESGGVYAWVRAAFGEKWGFVAIWLQWIQMPFGMVTILAFVAGGIAFAIRPSLAGNGWFVVVVVIVVYWSLTLLNLRGMRMSGLISTIGVIIGVFVPGIVIVAFASAYLFTSDPVQIRFTAEHVLPSLTSLHGVALMAGIIFVFTGMETSAAHANEVTNPQRNYPIAIFAAAAFLIVMNLAGGMSVAIVVPKQDISLIAGVFEAFEKFFDAFGVAWLVPIMAILAAVGATGQVSTWVVGPVKGLLSTADNGDIPPVFQKVNKAGIPVPLLILQASLVTVIAFVFRFVGINSAFLMIVNALVIIYMLMYILMFLAAIRLRYSQPDVTRAYRIPGRANSGMWIASMLGLAAASLVLITGFIEPAGLQVSTNTFKVFIAGACILMAGLPFVIWTLRRPRWKLMAKDAG